jgi:hypothetical protein
MAIIALSGRAGSGKDTVGEIIQFLTNKDPHTKVTTFTKNLKWAWGSDFEIKKFAGKLKAVGSLLTGIPIEMFEDQEFKKTDLPNEWVYIENGYAARNMTVREFLQKLGTDAMRDGLHKNVWINALYADYKEKLDPYHFKSHINESTLKYPNWILTDMRFPNELDSVKERDGLTIRINRTTFRTTETELGKLSVVNQPEVDKLLGIQEHPSETALDDAEFDYTINNNGTIEDLVNSVRRILLNERII